MARNYYWIVVGGWEQGIYTSWDGKGGARQASEGKSCEYHEGFPTFEEANERYKELTNGKQAFHRNWKQLEPIDVSQTNAIQPLSSSQQIECRLTEIQSRRESEKSNAGLQIDPQEIGRWGEEWALYKLLIKFGDKYDDDHRVEKYENGYRILKGDQVVVDLNWQNMHKESGQSPDILVNENGIKTYWEVKSTVNHNIGDFEITPNEWELAKQQSNRYSILRVMGTGTGKAQIIEINDPYQLWLNGLLIVNGVESPAKERQSQAAPEKAVAVESNAVLAFKETPTQVQADNKPDRSKSPNIDYKEGIGRRKEASARVRIYFNGMGTRTINNKSAEAYLTRQGDLVKAMEPLKLINSMDGFSISAIVKGGGVTSQTEAIRLGLARALLKIYPDLKTELRKNGLLTRDARVKERKKPGLKRARKAPTYTKR